MTVEIKKVTLTIDVWDQDYKMAEEYAQGKDIELFLKELVEKRIRDWGDRMETRGIKDRLIGLY